MSKKNGSKLGDVAATVSLVAKLPVQGEDQAARRRRLLADLCKMVGAHASGGVAQNVVGLSPRMRETLERLIQGDSERQIALRLKISQHTVHVYVRQLYKRFNVNSRGELLARFIR